MPGACSARARSSPSISTQDGAGRLLRAAGWPRHALSGLLGVSAAIDQPHVLTRSPWGRTAARERARSDREPGQTPRSTAPPTHGTVPASPLEARQRGSTAPHHRRHQSGPFSAAHGDTRATAAHMSPRPLCGRATHVTARGGAPSVSIETTSQFEFPCRISKIRVVTWGIRAVPKRLKK